MTKKQLSLILLDSEPITANPKEVIDIFMKAGKILFGVGVDGFNVPDDLWRMSYVRVCDTCVGMTIQDIRNAYNDAHIEKKEFRSLTRDELIAPVVEYNKRKQMVLNELKIAEKQVLEQHEKQVNVNEFKNKAIEKYKQCLIDGIEWNGDEFESNAFAKEQFADRIKQNRKDEIFEDAKREYRERRFLFEESTDQFKVPPPEASKIFARMICEEASRKHLLIIE